MATRRLAGLGIALVALLALVALASGAPRPLGVGGGTAHVGPQFFDYAFTTLVIAIAAAVVVTIMIVGRFQQDEAHRTRAWWSGVATLCGVLLLLALLARAHLIPNPGGGLGAAERADQRPRELPKDPPLAGGRDVELKWIPFAATGGIVILLLASAGLARRRNLRSRSPRERLDGAAAEVSTLLDDAVDDLRAERDVRRAVIAAYARLEHALAAHGLPRHPSEAPLEYLGRALLRLQATRPAVRTLTDLFEWAKFSPHEVDAGMRDEAVDALVQVRDELRAVAA